MITKQDLPILEFSSKGEWAAWLADNHAISLGLWLKIAKKSSGIATVSYADALDVALCYGWIDGQKAAFDDDHWLQRFTPRKSQSKWSKVNYAILYRIQEAERPETRARRIERYVAMLNERTTLHP